MKLDSLTKFPEQTGKRLTSSQYKQKILPKGGLSYHRRLSLFEIQAELKVKWRAVKAQCSLNNVLLVIYQRVEPGKLSGFFQNSVLFHIVYVVSGHPFLDFEVL